MDEPAGSASRRSSPWHAVSITTDGSSCAAARGFSGIRYLSADAPRLPLAHCAAPGSCGCSYKHHADRRAQPRRRDELVGLRGSRYSEHERRVTRGRREGD